MSAGYELKQLVPLKDDYKTVNKSIVPILEFIFDDELSHSISSVSNPFVNSYNYISFGIDSDNNIFISSIIYRLRSTVSLMFCSLN